MVDKITHLENFTNNLALEQAKLIENVVNRIFYDEKGYFPKDMNSNSPQNA